LKPFCRLLPPQRHFSIKRALFHRNAERLKPADQRARLTARIKRNPIVMGKLNDGSCWLGDNERIPADFDRRFDDLGEKVALARLEDMAGGMVK
jgi:hypothetical protein